MSNKYQGLSGKIGGLAVKGMIREAEERMVNGEHFSATSDSPEEAAQLQRVKAENERSGQTAR